MVIRLFKTSFNFAAGEYKDAKGKSLIVENLIKRLSHTRAWYRIERRQSVIKRHELADCYKGLTQLTNHMKQGKAEMMKDYFLIILFTGLRREEAARLQYSRGLQAYVCSYAEAIQVLFTKILEDNSTIIDLLVYPLLYLCRHYFEIQFKLIIELDGKEFTYNHNLQQLWHAAKALIKNR